MTQEQLELNKETVRKLFAAIDANDKEAFIACEHPEFSLQFTGFDKPMDREQHWEMAGMERKAFPDMHHIPEYQVAEGDQVVTRGHIEGTNLGDHFGKPATGKKINITFINFCTMKDGKIYRINSVFDEMAQHVQLYGPIE